LSRPTHHRRSRRPDARASTRGTPPRIRLGRRAPLGKAKKSARTPIAELGLRKGKSIAYLFDFGDEWRLLLKVADRWEAGDEVYPMLVDAEGVPPPQYPDLEDELDEGGDVP
jgi:hypothetical protein